MSDRMRTSRARGRGPLVLASTLAALAVLQVLALGTTEQLAGPLPIGAPATVGTPSPVRAPNTSPADRPAAPGPSAAAAGSGTSPAAPPAPSVVAPARTTSEPDDSPDAGDRPPAGTATQPAPPHPPQSPATPPARRYPDASTTGVPSGTRLVASPGLRIEEPGTVVDGLDVDGCIVVSAADVVIRRTRIRCAQADYAVKVNPQGAGVLIEDVEVDGRDSVGVAVCCSAYTLRRADVHHVIDGPRLVSGSSVLDSWVHQLSRAEGSHNDTLQATGGSGIVVRGNRLEPWRADTRDPFNAALQLGSTTSDSLEDVVVEGNFMNGGNYTVNIRKDTVARGIVFRDNTWGRDHRYGPVTAIVEGVRFDSSNVYLDDGSPVRSG